MTFTSANFLKDKKRCIEVFAKTALQLNINRFVLLLKAKEDFVIKYDIKNPIQNPEIYEEIIIVELIPQNAKNGHINYSINAWNWKPQPISQCP